MNYGCTKGAHIKTYRLNSRRWFALYHGANNDGVLLGVEGTGRTSDAAVRSLWERLHP